LAFADIKNINVDKRRMKEDDDDDNNNIMECWIMVMKMTRRGKRLGNTQVGVFIQSRLECNIIPHITAQVNSTQLTKDVYTYGS